MDEVSMRWHRRGGRRGKYGESMAEQKIAAFS